MKIRSFRFQKFSVPFNRPFGTSKGEIKERSGFILELTDDSGITGYGEASPLEDFGCGTLEFDEKELGKLEIQDFKIGDDFLSGSTNFLPTRSPSVRFAVEQAVLQILLKKGNNFDCLTGFKINPEIKVNGLIGFEKADIILSLTQNFVNSGFDTLKFKAGRTDFDEELRILTNIRNKFKLLNIRIDVNGNWTPEEAIYRLEKLSFLNLQYVEQPVADVTDLISLSEKSPVPICADESVRLLSDAEILINSGKIKYIVLKPSLTGGINDFFTIKKLAGEKNVNLIVSSAFESPLGFSLVSVLASTVSHRFAHGLGTQSYFRENNETDCFPIENGQLKINEKVIRNISPANFK